VHVANSQGGAPKKREGRRAALAAAERATGARLHACRELSSAVSAAVDTLTGAGSGLQRALKDFASGSAAIGLGSPVVERAANGILEACGSVSLTLISLAVVLSGEVQKPLDDLQRSVQADCARRSAELARLREELKARKNSTVESFEIKEKLSAQLQTALQEASSPEDAGRGAFSWLRMTGGTQQVAEAKLQQAIALQNAAVEEYARRSEQASEVGDRLQVRSDAFAEALNQVDHTLRTALCGALENCSAAWQSTAGSLSERAVQLREDAGQLRQALAGDGHEVLAKSSAPDVRAGQAACQEGAAERGIISELDPAEAVRKVSSGHKVGGADNAQQQAKLKGRASTGGDATSRDDLPEISGDVEGADAQAAVLSASWAELEARRAALKDAQEDREIKLLEREEALQELQAELQSQQQVLGDRRRTLAYEQARCLAVIEGTRAAAKSFGHSQIDVFVVSDEDDSPRSGAAVEEGTRAAEDVQKAGGEAVPSRDDAVWDMDWTSLNQVGGIRQHSPRPVSAAPEAPISEVSPARASSSGAAATPKLSSGSPKPMNASPRHTACSPNAAASPDEAAVGPDEAAAGHNPVAISPSQTAAEASRAAGSPHPAAVSPNAAVVSRELEEGMDADVSADSNKLDGTNPDAAASSPKSGTFIASCGQSPGGDGPSQLASAAAMSGPASLQAAEATTDVDEDLNASTLPPEPEALNAAPPRTAASARSSLVAPKEERRGSTFWCAPGVEPSSVGDEDVQALRRKLEEKRQLAELHNGEDHTMVPVRRQVDKGQMRGVHPELSEKFEARRRIIDAQDVGISPAITPVSNGSGEVAG